MEPKPLTHKQQQAFDFIELYCLTKNYSPTMVEIAAAMGITPGAVQKHLAALEEKGWITRKQDVPRSIWPVTLIVMRKEPSGV